MKDEFVKPVWIKVLLGFALLVAGLLIMYFVYKFFPMPKGTGFDGLGSILLILFCLGGIEILYILGVIFSRRLPSVIFTFCLLAFVIVLGLIRWLEIG